MTGVRQSAETALSAEELRAKHQQHVHRGGCHRWFDHNANELLDLTGPAGWCDGCEEDWPCDTTRALNRAVVGEPPAASWRDASRALHASGDDEPYGTDAALPASTKHDHNIDTCADCRRLGG